MSYLNVRKMCLSIFYFFRAFIVHCKHYVNKTKYSFLHLLFFLNIYVSFLFMKFDYILPNKVS